MKRVVTFGEIMLRLEPQGYTRFLQADAFGAIYGGGEANVAASLANFGMDASFITKLPAHEIGQAAVNSLRKYGVDTSGIIRGGERLGIYYLEKGASQRPSKVIYDRKYSAISMASPEEFDWDTIFEGANWFHFSGITLAISEAAAQICLQACKIAKEKKITVSFDMNYRKNLWSLEKARETVLQIAPYIDVCFANEMDAVKIFSIEEPEASGNTVDAEGQTVLQKLACRYGYKMVATTFRDSISASDNGLSAQLYDGSRFYRSRQYQMHIVDRVGGGDAFDAGLIYALMNDYAPQEAIEFAVAAGCLKHSIEGDCNLVSVAEVEALAMGDGTGRVQR